MNDIEDALRSSLRDRVASIAVEPGFDAVAAKVRRRRHRRRLRAVVGASAMVAALILGGLAAMADDRADTETAEPGAASEPPTTITLALRPSTTNPPITTNPIPEIPPCPFEVVPRDTTPLPNGGRPFPTFVPGLHFEGMTLEEASCEADRVESRLRVWKVDGIEVDSEEFGGGVINLTLEDGIVVVAEFSPSPVRVTTSTSTPDTTTAPPNGS